ncbi:helix-turn-helix domain-containing protein [Sinorhizobium meliloti]|uniref:helix-turn-helix domain-containing protein n=1 Tax=Rhizobium meliloti TaxID=382 RepID=UPI00299D44D2|nr:hypothetical protein [Sinorhizobium meliloti]
MQAQPELMRQHEAYKAVRERLFSKPKPKPAPALSVLRDYDAHVRAFRDWCALRDRLKAASTSSTISVSFGPYASCSAPVALEEDTEIVTPRRFMKDICLEVLERFPGVTLEDVKGRRRNRYIVAARHACMHAIHCERKDISFPVLGRFFERDHTSCMAAVRNIEGGKVWTGHPPPQSVPTARKADLSAEEIEFLRRISIGQSLKSGKTKDRSQERPRARMRNAGFAEYSERSRRWLITPAGLEALKKAKESA